ncbi:MAG: hypothetical protein H6744_18385 [Deltaproteobacteria bacterium]|nr:hypothetical protein [Deltaproteobacteria bacterium]MCB9788649.1 hypothetical protein [Deltaproteobacteria bacterium]
MAEELQFVFDRALDGYHHLFDEARLREALSLGPPSRAWVDAGTAREAESLIESLRGLPGIEAQRARIAQASPAVQRVMIHLYFDFLYRYLERRRPTFH